MRGIVALILLTLMSYATVYENAEDSKSVRWIVYDYHPSGATITNVYDAEKSSRVIEFQGDGQDNSYLIGHLYSTVSRAWNDTDNKIMKWDFKYSEPYTIYIRVYTNEGYKYIIYTNDDDSKGKINSLYVHVALGNSTIDGTWQTIERNLEDDLSTYIPSSTIISVEGMIIRGSGRIDNIELNTASGGSVAGGIAPIANAGSDLTTSVGESITIFGTGTDDGSIAAYRWEKSGVLLSNSASFVYTPTEEGIETFTLTVTDDVGLTANDTMQLRVNPDARSIDYLNATLYEDAEDQKTFGWSVYDKEPVGATIKNIFDAQRGSRVIELEGDNQNNAYELQTPIGEYFWGEKEKYIIEWSMRTNNNYDVYIHVTTNVGERFLHYTPIDHDIGGTDPYVHHGLGSNSKNDNWHTFTRNLKEDLNDYLPNETLISVNKFMLRGNARVDDIKLMGYTLLGDDTTPPVIQLDGDQFITLSKGEVYVEAGATATDNSDSVASLEAAMEIDNSSVNTNVPGRYKVTYDLTDSAGNHAKTAYRIVTVRDDKDSVGIRKFYSENKSSGTIFISPSGSGTECTQSRPCNFSKLSADLTNDRIKIEPGDIVLFRAGVYELNVGEVETFSLTGGTKSLPVIYESYPGERVVFDGGKIGTEDNAADDWRKGVLQLTGEYAILRNVEIRNMPTYGIRIYGNYNIIEHCTIYNNHLSGIEVTNGDFEAIDDTKGSYNIIRDNKIFFNSDAGLDHHNYKKGDNADGITVHSGSGNIVEHNDVYSNSDDGIDTWLSVNSVVSYNKVYDNGRASGNGNGIKLGGTVNSSPLGANAIADHNLVYLNVKDGLSINSGKNVVMKYNTAYKNYRYGLSSISTTTLQNNISWKNALGDVGWDNNAQVETGNSWQIGGEFETLEYHPYKSNYLRPNNGSDFDSIGAYAVE
ncbi:MAG TPA: DUF5011 domain-containing protein [Arcobacter sp.]|nr:DUF5011 domain-containing protein [Arcobacter sp.]